VIYRKCIYPDYSVKTHCLIMIIKYVITAILTSYSRVTCNKKDILNTKSGYSYLLKVGRANK